MNVLDEYGEVRNYDQIRADAPEKMKKRGRLPVREVSELLKAIAKGLKKRGYTGCQVAQVLNVSESTVDRWQRVDRPDEA